MNTDVPMPQVTTSSVTGLDGNKSPVFDSKTDSKDLKSDNKTDNKDDKTDIKTDEKTKTLPMYTGKDHAEIVTLVSKDKKEFKVTRRQAYVSILLRRSFEDNKCTSTDVPSVDSKTLGFIVEYMKIHDGVEPSVPKKPIKTKDMSKEFEDKRDATLFEKLTVVQDLYNVITAANYMDMYVLLHTACAAIAILMKGHPLDKIKKLLLPESELVHNEKDVDKNLLSLEKDSNEKK